MSRSLLIGIVATIVLFTGIAVFFYFNNIKEKGRSASEAIPNDAFFIFESKNIQLSWQNFTSSSLWKDLQNNETVKQLGIRINDINDLINAHEDVKEFLAENTSAVSMHSSGTKLNLLIATETGGKADPSVMAYAYAERIKGKVVRRTFEKIPVFDVMDVSGNLVFTISFYEQVMLCSSDPGLIEDGMRKLKYRLPNVTKGFEQVKLLAESSADANLYVNYQRLPKFFALFTKPEHTAMFSYLKSFANWSMLDVKIENAAFKISGVTYTDDSVFQFLDLFKNQTPKLLKLQEMMPANTSFALQMGFTDYLKFNAELKEYLEVHKKSELYQRFADSIESRYDIEIKQSVLPFIDGEAALVMTEPANSDYQSNISAFIRFKDPVSMGAALKSYVRAMDIKGEADSVSYFYEGIEIERIKLGNFLKLYYGELMENINSPYFALINDVYVFCNDVNALKNIITQYKSGTTLSADEKFKAYEATLARNNNINVFISPSKNLLLPAQFVTDSFFSTLNTYQSDFRKFEFFNIQFANTNNKAFYTNVSFKYNVVNNSGDGLLWNYKLDTTFSMAPQVVYNSKLKQNIIFVQDIKNTLYCINNSGGLIWRSKLSSKLVNDVTLLDYKNDGNSYYFIATEKSINIIDGDGVSMNGFPINHPGKTSLPVTLNRSSGDTALTCFAVLDNNRIMAYNSKGRPMQGWNPRMMDARAVQSISFFEFGSKQLYYTTDSKGHLMIYNLKGERVKIKTEFSASYFYHKPSADTTLLIFTALDTNGTIKRITIDSTNRISDSVTVANAAPFVKISSAKDIVTFKQWYILHSMDKWVLYNDDWRRVSEHAISDSSGTHVYFNTDQASRLSIAKAGNNQHLYEWFDLNGKMIKVIPVKGVSRFSENDVMLDRKNYIIGGDESNNIFVYRLK